MERWSRSASSGPVKSAERRRWPDSQIFESMRFIKYPYKVWHSFFTTIQLVATSKFERESKLLQEGIRRGENEGARMSFEDSTHKTDLSAAQMMCNISAMVWLWSSTKGSWQAEYELSMAIASDSNLRISDSYTVPRDVGSQSV